MPEDFGHYRLDELLGRGGMGEVWRAYDTRQKRIVAIKRLPAAWADNEDLRNRFLRECSAAARLSHRHLASVHNSGEIDGRLYMDMECIDGTSLATLIGRGGLTPGRAVEIVVQVARALDHAHSQHLVHRDVKPANVLVVEDGEDFAYLIDFGVSSTTDGTRPDARYTRAGMAVGTPAYMAPEQLEGDPAHQAMDVYSLACVLYETLTGRAPFHDAEDVRTAHRSSERPVASVGNRSIPRALDDVISKGMDPVPQLRYTTAGELARAATAALARTTRVDPAPGRPRTVADAVSEAARSGPRAATAQAAAPPPPTAAAGPDRTGPSAPQKARRQWPRWSWSRARTAEVLAAALGAAVVAAVVGVVGLGVWWIFLRPTPPEPGIPIADSPRALAVNADSTTAVVVLGDANQVVQVDLASGAVGPPIAVGRSPQDIALAPTGATAYAASRGDDSIAVIDVRSGTVPTTIPVGDEPVGVALSEDGSRLFVAESADASVSVIDTTTNERIASVTAGASLLGDSVHGVAVSPDGRTLAVTVRAGWLAFGQEDRVVLVGLDDGDERHVVVGDDPGAVAFADEGRRAYVADEGGPSVSVVDVVNASVTTTVPLDLRPTNLAAGPDGRRVVVTATGDDRLPTTDGSMIVIATDTNTVVATAPTLSGPADVALGSDGQAYVVSPIEGRFLGAPLP